MNRVEERKLLPESDALWVGLQALRAHHYQDNGRLYPRAPGRNSHPLCLSRCAGDTTGGRKEGGDIDRSEPLKLTNHRSIRHRHRLSLSPLLSLCQLCFLSLSPSTTQQALRASEGPPAPLVWSERSHDQQASTRSRTHWLTAQAQPRQKDPEGVNSTISELFHMTQQSSWQIKGWRIGYNLKTRTNLVFF